MKNVPVVQVKNLNTAMAMFNYLIFLNAFSAFVRAST